MKEEIKSCEGKESMEAVNEGREGGKYEERKGGRKGEVGMKDGRKRGIELWRGKKRGRGQGAGRLERKTRQHPFEPKPHNHILLKYIPKQTV